MPDGGILIRGGTFFSMTDGGGPEIASVAVRDGKVAGIYPPGREPETEAGLVFDAGGMFVAPGFVDIHIHDEYFGDPDTVQHCLIRQGVTTAVAGNCGSGPDFAESAANRTKPWLNLAYLVGNCAALREGAGHADRYTPASPDEMTKMREILRDCLAAGALGLSLGLEYAPGASYGEIDALVRVAGEFSGRIVTAHIRHDDHRCADAVREVLKLSRDNGARVQISHLGSMTMGRTMECAGIINRAVSEGVDAGFDCYPYDAFCAKAASAVYDGDLPKRWNGKGAECLEPVSGKFKGQRLTVETLAQIRRETPAELVIAHVMDRDEVESCLADPNCVIASDALYAGGGAHPRIAGTFPRAFRILRERGYDWQGALRKATAMPADRMRLGAGRLSVGSAADVVVFDPDNFTDRATFDDPFAPPSGLKLVLVNGQVAFRDGEITKTPRGNFIRRL
jgi:N-acyl-D-amino-acid deacylase